MKKGFTFLIAMILILTSMIGVILPKVESDEEDSMAIPYLELGDLVFIEYNTFGYQYSLWGWDHIGIYIGNSSIIEAIPGGVTITNLVDIISPTVDVAYGFVNASEQQRHEAVNFSINQLNKPYQEFETHFSIEDLYNLDLIAMLCNRTKDASPDSDAWYCSELVWAAYFNQDVEIDKNGDGPFDRPNWVWPVELSSDDNVTMYPDYVDHELNECNASEFWEWFVTWVHDFWENSNNISSKTLDLLRFKQDLLIVLEDDHEENIISL